MKSIHVTATAIAFALATMAAQTAVAASACSQTCSASYNQCTARGGGQSSCMTSWMQCRNVCNGVATPKPTPPAKATPAAATKPAPRP